MKDYLYTRFIFNIPFNYKHIATSCQILCGDGLYVVTIKLNKTSSHLVMQLMISCQVNGYQENYGHQRRRIQVISQRQFSLQEEFCYRMLQQVCQSYDQQLYLQESNLKRNIDCNFCSKLLQIFQMPKNILKPNWLGIVIVQLPFKKPNLEVNIFNRPTIPSFSMMEFTTTGFELMYHYSENTIHFSILTMQIFPLSKKIRIPKYNAVSYS